MTSTRTLRIAGVQMANHLGRRDENLARAADFAAKAAASGAQLILFPECMPSGYDVSTELWQGVEGADGPTARWLRRTSADLRVYLGTSYPELDAGHIYNTFVLTGPDGAELGRVRKSHAETYLFRPQPGPHVIDCALGRIGVGICADNLYADFVRLVRRAHVDLLLMPHNAPAARRVGGLVSPDDVRNQHDYLAQLAPRYAAMLGAPAIFVNACGETTGRPGVGIIGKFVTSTAFHFPGLTTIADSDGRVVSRLGEEEGVAIADVTIDPSRYPAREPTMCGKFAMTRRSVPQRALFAVEEALGRFHYARRRHTVHLGPDAR